MNCGKRFVNGTFTFTIQKPKINCEHLNKGNNMDFEKYTVPRQLITTIDDQLALGYGEVKFRNAFEKM